MKKGVESPRLQVELLLAHVLKMPRMKLYLSFDRILKSEELDQLREFVKRRGNREPLQHIVGTTSFCGLEIAVNRNVLIPRPETEVLAERTIQFLSSVDPQPSTVLDFGTGSGCLAIAIAVQCPSAQLYAVDVSAEALATARENATRNKVGDRVRFLQSDGFASLSRDLKFHLIVSNPPYIPNADIAALQPEVRDFDPRLALDGGVQGLDFYEQLSREAPTFLLPDGRLMVEFGDGQAEAIRRIFETQEWSVEGVERDLSGRERFLIAGR